jgi:hypothetical protein
MRMRIFSTLAVIAIGTMLLGASPTAWHMNASTIEACSCPQFCQCYFNAHPSGHASHASGESHPFCRFNNAYKINKGNYGGTKLDGAKFWLSGDLGGDFTQGKMDWAVVTFDKSVTKDQREALMQILPKLFPVQWNSFKSAEGDIDWQASGDSARATLDGGKTAEVSLKATKGNSAGPVVIKNLPYWGAARNDGFVMMPNTIEAYRAGDKPYEYKDSNGFMITIDMDSKDYDKK